MAFLKIIVTNMFEVNLDTLFFKPKYDIETLQNKLYDSIDSYKPVFMHNDANIQIRFKYINNNNYDKDKTTNFLFEYEFISDNFKDIEDNATSIYENVIKQAAYKDYILPTIASIYEVDKDNLYNHITLRKLGYSTRTSRL